MRRWSVFGLLLLSLLLPRFAMADYPVTDFAVKCDSAHNRVLIRFVVIDSDDVVKTGSIIHRDLLYTDKSNPAFYTPPLPAALNARWQGIPYRNETGCTLQNGQTITLAQEHGPVGQGWLEAIADEYFTMKIDNHYVFFQYYFYSGQAPVQRGLLLDAVEYAGGKLILCKAPEEDNKGQLIHGPKCLDESKRLLPGDKYLSEYEKNELSTYRETQKEDNTARRSASKIKKYVSPLCKPIFAGLNSSTTPPGFTFYFEKKHYLTRNPVGGGIYYSSSIVSLYNNKAPGRAVEVGALKAKLNFNDQSYIYYFGKNEIAYHRFVSFLQRRNMVQIEELFYYGVNANAFAPWQKFYVGLPLDWLDAHGLPDFAWIGVSRTFPPRRLRIDPIIGYPGTVPDTTRINTIIGYRGAVYVFTMPIGILDPSAGPAIIIRKLMPDKSEKLICAFPYMIAPDRRY